jgi:hypothetical protein
MYAWNADENYEEKRTKLVSTGKKVHFTVTA